MVQLRVWLLWNLQVRFETHKKAGKNPQVAKPMTRSWQNPQPWQFWVQTHINFLV
jgi:hypothetical protein